MKPKVGIGYREPIHEKIMEHSQDLECLELISEHFFSPRQCDLLLELNRQFALIPHGLDLSVGSYGDRRDYERQVLRLVELIDPPYYSDHLALTQVPGIFLHNLTPLFFCSQQLERVIDRIHALQDLLQRPLVLENITQLIRFPGQMPPSEFFHRLVEKTECGLLLDVTNTYVDSFNYSFDPWQEMQQWPLDAVYHVHLSGGRTQGEEKMDGHDSPIEKPSWELFQKALPHMPKLQTVIIERDANFHDFSALIKEVKQAQTLIHQEALCTP